jgi:hypothetical protein
MLQIVSLVLVLAASSQNTSPALRLVVIEGEDAVNIIQQKSAVRPVVEVRDRNNLPIPGAVVTFSVQGGQAAFGGASTLTVATNAAGQAAVTSFTPSAAGAFQIQVSAAFQGQVATATITQTNVMTAAQAAAASAASGSGTAGSASGGTGGGAGGAAGGAGGLSTTTLVVAGAAVAGGAVAAVELKDKIAGGEKYTGSFSGTISGSFTGGGANACTYTRTVTATAKLGLREHTDSVVRGEFDYEGTSTVTASTCPATPEGPQFTGSVDELTGSPSSFTGRQVFPGPPATGLSGERISGEHVYNFQGSITGDTVTGVFRYEENSLAVGGPGGNVTQLGVGTFSITFQKQ